MLKRINSIILSFKEIKNKADLWLNPKSGLKYYTSTGWENIPGTIQEVKWSKDFNLNTINKPGVYICNNVEVYSEENNIPVVSIGDKCSFVLTVSESETLGQSITLNTKDGVSILTRVKVNGEYSNWSIIGKPIDLGTIPNTQLNSLVDPGNYSFLVQDKEDTTLAEVIQQINSYKANVSTDNGIDKIPEHSKVEMEVITSNVNTAVAFIVQRAKILLFSGMYIEIQRRQKAKEWSNWFILNHDKITKA